MSGIGTMKTIAKKLLYEGGVAQQLYNLSLSINKEMSALIRETGTNLDISVASGSENSVDTDNVMGSQHSIDFHTHINRHKIFRPPSENDLRTIIHRCSIGLSLGGMVYDGVMLYAIIPTKDSTVPTDLNILVAEMAKMDIMIAIKKYKTIMQENNFWFWARIVAMDHETNNGVDDRFDMSKHISERSSPPMQRPSQEIADEAKRLLDQYYDLLGKMSKTTTE